LAEQLASVDVREFTAIDGLRRRIIDIVSDFLHKHPKSVSHAASEPFYFCAADIVVLPTPFVADSVTAFLDGLRQVSVHSIHHHFIEARLRLKLMSNDFSQWLHEDAGLTEAARALNRIDIYTATLEQVRSKIVRVVETSLS
jgi:elongation factor P hydroxylase